MANELPVLRGEQCTLRPVRDADIPGIVAILRDPTVARWWGEYDAARVRRDFFDDDVAAFVIEVGGEPAGVIQYTEENEPDYRHAGIDLALAERYQGRGLGPDAIRAVARYLFEERGHHRLTIDPRAGNRNAIRAYERVGFRPVGILRQYERGADGAWHDGLLMDLLASELR